MTKEKQVYMSNEVLDGNKATCILSRACSGEERSVYLLPEILLITEITNVEFSA
jgi:hypothetical protein